MASAVRARHRGEGGTTAVRARHRGASGRAVAAVALGLLTSACTLDDAPLRPGTTAAGGNDASPDGPPWSAVDAGPDAAPCAVDQDGDRSCAGVDCDDGNRRRSPDLPEYCPDNLDDDCDGLTDYADECEVSNDGCDPQRLAVLRQDPARDSTFWQFEVPLGDYTDDVAAGLAARIGNCTATTGQDGHDAFFLLVATTDADVRATAVGGQGASAALILQREACGQSADGDRCSVQDSGDAQLDASLASGQEAWLVVDDAAATGAGTVTLEVRVSKQGL